MVSRNTFATQNMDYYSFQKKAGMDARRQTQLYFDFFKTQYSQCFDAKNIIPNKKVVIKIADVVVFTELIMDKIKNFLNEQNWPKDMYDVRMQHHELVVVLNVTPCNFEEVKIPVWCGACNQETTDVCDMLPGEQYDVLMDGKVERLTVQFVQEGMHNDPPAMVDFVGKCHSFSDEDISAVRVGQYTIRCH